MTLVFTKSARVTWNSVKTEFSVPAKSEFGVYVFWLKNMRLSRKKQVKKFPGKILTPKIRFIGEIEFGAKI
jgi:hypothetical protein